MKIAVARTKTSRRWRTVDMSWDQVLTKLRRPYRTPETIAEYHQMSREDQGRAKDAAGGFVAGELNSGIRRTETVVSRSMVTLDADDAKPDAWGRGSLMVEYRMAAYSTHSHTSKHPRIRWVIPTDRPMTPDEYQAVARRLAQWLDIESMDPTTYEVARLMYWPTVSADGEYEFHEQEGPICSVDKMLRTYGPNEEWRDISLWPMSSSETTIRSTEMRKAGDPLEKPGMVGLFCRTYDVPSVIDTFLPDVYEDTEQDDRYTYVNGTTAAGAIVYNDGAFLYSNHATDPVGGHSVNSFDLVRIHRFGELDLDCEEGTPLTKLPSYTAMCKWCAELPEIKHKLAEEREAQMLSDFADLVGEGAASEHDWEEDLELNKKTGECEPTINNALLIILNDDRLKGTIGYDLFAERPVRRARVPWRSAAEVQGEWTDVDEAGLRFYLQRRWKFRSESDLKNALELAFQAGAFHPVRDYLNSLEWDGTPRLETVLHDHMGAEDTPLNRAICRKWFTAGVKRVMEPGCKFDNLLVLQGKQGLGKSTFLDVISRGWFNDSRINMETKEGYEVLHGCLIVELAELASMKRTDVETVKTFLSKREDTYRAAYDRRSATRPRQCIFAASTNEEEFLKDRTGARRFWPIRVTKHLNAAKLEAVVDQLWAEAYYYYKHHEPLYLDTEELNTALVDVNEERTVQDDLIGELMEYLDTPLPDNWEDYTPEMRRDYIQGNSLVRPEDCRVRRDEVSIVEVKYEFMGIDKRGSGRDLESRRVANILNNLHGWKKTNRKWLKNYGLQWVYTRTDIAEEPEKEKSDWLE